MWSATWSDWTHKNKLWCSHQRDQTTCRWTACGLLVRHIFKRGFSNFDILIEKCNRNWSYVKPGLHLSVFAENRRERIANMISVNRCLRVFFILGDPFSRSREKAVFWVREKGARTVFYIFLTFSWRIDASVNQINGFSSIFAANIRSHLFSANDNKCKPSFRKVIFEKSFNKFFFFVKSITITS